MDDAQPATGPAAGTEPGTPTLAAFGRTLFARVAREDMARVPVEILAALTADAFQRFRERPLGRPMMTLLAPAAWPEGSVLEIINDDMPFLLDSTLAELTERGLEPRLVAHPIVAVERDAAGHLLRFHGEASAAGGNYLRESVIHIHLPRLDPAEGEAIVAALERSFRDIRVAVLDWAAMRSRIARAIARYQATPPPLPLDEVSEAVQFLEWLIDDNFTLLGVREYGLRDHDAMADPVDGTGLGILRDPEVKILRRGGELVAITPEIRAFLQEPQALIITKANVKSRVHRRVHMDYVGVKLFDDHGHLAGELRIAGLFTATAYTGSVRTIPYLRRKVSAVMRRFGFDSDSHSGRALLNIMESYPRDELFQLDAERLHAFALDILALGERPRLRALIRPDRFDRFVSVLVYIPKDRYDTAVRRKVGAYLAERFEGRVSAAYPAYPEGPLARTHYIIGRDGGPTPLVAREEVEAAIAAIVRTWADQLREAVAQAPDPAAARALTLRHAERFGAAYREQTSGAETLADMAGLAAIDAGQSRLVDLYRKPGEPETRATLKVFSRGGAMVLSERVPILEAMGFRVINERTYRIAPADAEGAPVWLHDMTLERSRGGSIDLAAVEGRVEQALLAVFAGACDSDRFNTLVLEAGLDWREVMVFRAYARFAQQIGAPHDLDYMAATLARHPELTGALMRLFQARFDPDMHDEERATREEDALAALEAGLAGVASLDEDRILRRFGNLIRATLRTDAFQVGADGQPRPAIAFKLRCADVADLPAPRPHVEIFVHSPRVEGVHLRFGPVARGGLRWSDRPQDVRTEVLGLVKAQQVKNAVIVPVGAKGGFVPRQLPPPGDRAAWLREGTEAYKLFVRTLLTLTDNIDAAGRIVPPPLTVRHDGDDPYLVVAADKGTATFSDVANALSQEAGHWLDDAFASGGSAGYDHKKMGITARGAWEAVKRHFREMDRDIQSSPVTVAGVGDMSGDVFGNGMLLSREIRLVAAFDHRDIFLDPDPDPVRSFAERERLFHLPRSSWADYDRGALSPGGGVFSRTAKAIPLAPEVRELLGLRGDTATPQDVMRAILRAPVDLLWFGGIGTYVRASDETDAEVGDRANDALRITARELGARVIGEGANLGMTQRARIEAGRRGVRLNTDAIDNSAGVNSSDIEVNIKIALAVPMADGRLDRPARNDLLAAMTDEVAAKVLRNNYLQSLALSLAERRGSEDLPFARELLRRLEAEGRLDRAVEGLPDDTALRQREAAGEGLTRPELAVLLAYAKLSLFDRLIATPAVDDPYFSGELERYFPEAVVQRFPDAVAGHRLRRDIIATQLANAIVNRGGPTIEARIGSDDAGRLALAYAAVREAFGLLEINNAIDGLDNQVPSSLQLELYVEVQAFALDSLGWFVRHGRFEEGLGPVIEAHREGVTAIHDLAALVPAVAGRHAQLRTAGVPDALAIAMARLPLLGTVPELVRLAREVGRPVAAVAGHALAADQTLAIAPLVAEARRLSVGDRFERLALTRAIDETAAATRRLAAAALRHGEEPTAAMAALLVAGGERVVRSRAMLEEIRASGLSVAKLAVAAGLLHDMAGP